MLRIVVVPSASPVHPEGYYMSVYKEILDSIKDYSGLIVDKPLTSSREIPQGDIYVVAVLTGGVSDLTFRTLSETGKPVVLVAKGEHNALASALSIKSRLLSSGLKATIYPVSDTMSYAKAVKDVLDSIKASEDLRRIKVLEINESGLVSVDAKRFMEHVGGVVEAVGFTSLFREGGYMESEVVKEIVETFNVGNVDENVSKTVSLTSRILETALSKSVDAITIDCFPMILKHGYTPCVAVSLINSRGLPFVCENDFYSLPLMFLTQRLTGFPGWVANPSGFDEEGLMRLAHCTIARSLCRECRLIKHFETGRPFGVSGVYLFGRVLITRLSRDYKTLRMYYGDVHASGFLNENYCRTQILVKPRSLDPYGFYETALGNHHVVSPLIDNLDRKLNVVSWWLGWRVEKNVY